MELPPLSSGIDCKRVELPPLFRNRVETGRNRWRQTGIHRHPSEWAGFPAGIDSRCSEINRGQTLCPRVRFAGLRGLMGGGFQGRASDSSGACEARPRPLVTNCSATAGFRDDIIAHCAKRLRCGKRQLTKTRRSRGRLPTDHHLAHPKYRACRGRKRFAASRTSTGIEIAFPRPHRFELELWTQ